MDKKIGKYSLLYIMFFVGSCLGVPKLSLHIHDMNGDDLEQAQVNTPFIVEVTVTNDESQSLPHPKIDGLDKVQLLGSGSTMRSSTYNGATTYAKTYSIRVLASELGDVTIGPAYIDVDGTSVRVDPVTVTVAEKQKVSDEKTTQAFVTMNFDKERIYVGQDLRFRLRFYYGDHAIRLEKISEPLFNDFTAGQLSGPKTGTDIIDNTTYRYLEWTATVSPTKSGTLKIDPIEAALSVPRKAGRNRMGFDVVDLFGGSRGIERMYSNTLTVDVLPVPHHDPPVTAVGKFSSLEASLNNTEAIEGEGVILKVSLTGSGNIEQLKHPELHLPDTVTMYESGTHSTDVTVGKTIKTFEYVLQSSVSGECTIPEQQFFYFDPEKETFHTLTTDPVVLTIVGRQEPAQKPVQTVVHDEGSYEKELSIITGGLWKRPRYKELPIWLFFVLLAIPLFGWIMYHLCRYWNARQDRYAPEIRYNKAFKKAGVAFDKARAGNYDGHLYHIFIEIFAARLKLPKEKVTEHMIENVLRDGGFSTEQLLSWRLFFAHMAECAFSSYGTTQRNDKLFNQAAHWLSELEKVL